MKLLTNIEENSSVFILEMECEDYVDHLNSLGILPDKLITVIKNPSGNAPLVLEVDDGRYAVSKDIAKTIYVTPVLDGQDYIFDENYKKTKQRGTILDVLKLQEGHFSLEDITKKVQAKDSRIGSVTVYRTIKILCEKNVLDTLLLSDGSRRFEVRKGVHDHIICENCFSIMDLMNEDVFEIEKKIAEEKNIDISHHNLKLFRKTCPRCNKLNK